MKATPKDKTVEIKRYNPSFDEGLTKEQIEERLTNDLVNKEKDITKSSYAKIVVRNIFTFFNILLFTIAIILSIFQLWSNMVFMVILIANLSIGLFWDVHAKKIVGELSLIQKTKITVIRNGERLEVYNDELLLDDVVVLKRNDLIPCDSIILKGVCFCNESILTGESDVIKKEVGDHLLSGSYLTSGEVYALVNKIGDDNYIKQLQAKSKEYKRPRSQLYIQLNSIFKVITILVIVVGLLQIGVMFGINADDLLDKELTYNRIALEIVAPLAGSLISLIPSGMYLLSSTSLTVGIINLSKDKVLVNDMYSLDTLARVDVLCIDKTGTITDGKMIVKDFDLIEKNIKDLPSFNDIMSSFNGVLNEDNFTSLALKDKFGSDIKLEKDQVIYFDSLNKFSAVSFKNIGTVVLGAYEFLGCKVDEEVSNLVNKYMKEGERILTVAHSNENIKNGKKPKDLEVIAIIRIEDHIKDDAKEILDWFKGNDVKVKILSGDNNLAVQKIAKDVGLKDYEESVSLDGLSDEEVKNLAEEKTIFGRVSPEQKRIVVDSLKEKGHTVAMFGDGVNDILAFKSADVSISVANGAAAAKDLANLILINNNFSALPSIVAQGRRVINNLQRTCSVFLVKTTFAVIMNIFFVIFGLTTGITWPFLTNSFYCWELCAIGLSSFFLALEPNSERIKDKFINNIIRRALPSGIILSLGVMLLYVVMKFTGWVGNDPDVFRTIATYYISIGSMIVLFEVCMPFNLYRGLVFLGSSICCIILFVWSIYGFNWLLLEGNEAPRYLEGNEITLTLASIFITLGIFIILWVVQRILAKRKEIKNER